SVDEILAHIKQFHPLPQEQVPLDKAWGRVLAETFAAPTDLPGFCRSSMDGFALNSKSVFGASESAPALLDLIGQAPMGEATNLVVNQGEAVQILTGGMVPQGADCVVMLEYARPAGPKQIEITRPAAPLENIILADEDAQKGETLLPQGRLLRPQEVGLLAALGQQIVSVHKRPQVAIISSGDEIVPTHVAPNIGQVRDINSYTLSALVEGAGGITQRLGIAHDNQANLKNKLTAALLWADVVLLSGGSSAGQRDYTLEVFNETPELEILAHGVAISPGKPLILGRLGQKSLWGLPGHAASCLVCAEIFIKPLLAQLSGQRPKRPWGLKAILSRSLASAQGRRDYIRVKLSESGDPNYPLLATPILGKSGLISTLVEAEALVVCPENQEGLEGGQLVEIHPAL
ncbi:MAG: molybdopterin molybdotransferase MoeA, partial [Candidatus Adiutrix sp.]